MSLKTLDLNEFEVLAGKAQMTAAGTQTVNKISASEDTQITDGISTLEDVQMTDGVTTLEDKQMTDEISTLEDEQMPHKITTSENLQLIQDASNSDEIQMKEINNHTDFPQAANTDPMIQKEEEPSKDNSSDRSLYETGATESSNFCRRRPTDLTKRQIMKNVLVVSSVFLLNFIAYGGLAALQSSLHVQQGMGVINQAVLYVSMAVSCLTLPKIVISLLGHKWCMCLSLTGYLVWMAANGVGAWATMLPASIIIGISGATLWTAQASYLTTLARHYAAKTGQETAPAISLFFGIFAAIFANYNVIGSIISSTVLGRSTSINDQSNQTNDMEDELLVEFCGLNDCPGSSPNTTIFSKPPSPVIWTLVGVYVAIAFVALLICCVFVDPLPRSWVQNTKSDSYSTRQMVTSSLMGVVRQMGRLKQLLLIPITIYLGMEQTFLEAEYTRSFVSCFLAIWMVGWCLIPASICKSLGCFLGGKVTKYTGIIPVLICGLLLDLSFQLTLWFWTPSGRQLSLFFVVPVFSALADSVWTVQLRAVYGVLFSDDSETAFSCFQFFQSCGFILGFAYSSFLCTRLKLQILTSMLALGLTLLFVDVFVYREKLSKPLRRTADVH